MSDPRKGIRLPLSPARKLVCEILHHARKVPSLPLSKDLCVAELVTARRLAPSAPSWLAIFMKACGMTARRHPPLRQAYISWPVPHLYEHPISECALLIEREWRGEPIVLGAKFRAPENSTLTDIDDRLRRFREAPVESIGYFRQMLRVGRFPGWLRRLAFWQALHLSGYKRARRFGTFVMSSLGPLGVEQHHPLSPLTSYFTFGPVRKDGSVTAKIIYDHRVVDGMTIARCLMTLQDVLHDEIMSELWSARAAA